MTLSFLFAQTAENQCIWNGAFTLNYQNLKFVYSYIHSKSMFYFISICNITSSSLFKTEKLTRCKPHPSKCSKTVECIISSGVNKINKCVYVCVHKENRFLTFCSFVSDTLSPCLANWPW